MKITLLGHSGFLVEGNSARLVFDYYQDPSGALKRMPMDKPTVFFASHSHYDHFNRSIFSFAGKGNVGFVLGTGIPKHSGAVSLDKGQSAEVLGIPVCAFGSTDTGVSFLAELDSRKLFHAGDLNDWYWEEESTAAELEHDEKWFLDEIEPLKGAEPEVAFLPVDARLKQHALRGPIHFVCALRPRLVVPMHLCGGTNLPTELSQALKREGLKAEVANIMNPGDFIEI